jgi:hypothetical protein
MSIQTNSEDLGQIRERLRKMSDHELRKFGRAASVMADPTENFGTPNPAFQFQLDEARAEWRRRHPVDPDRARHNPRLPCLRTKVETLPQFLDH